MLNIAQYLVKEDWSTASENKGITPIEHEDPDDFEEYLDNINNFIEQIHQEIDQFNQISGNIADNDLTKNQTSIKSYIYTLADALDQLDKEAKKIDEENNTSILKQ